MRNLNPFFYPASIAVVGASVDETHPSGIILSNLKGIFKGKLYPVNPHHRKIKGITSYPSIQDIPGKVDLSIIITPPHVVPGLIREHVEKNINHVIIASAGFGETEIGKGLQKEIEEIIQSSPLRVIGPNCLGIYNPVAGVDTFFLPRQKVPRPDAGGISIISQSGSILGTTMILMRENSLGISKGISYGNRIDVDEGELIEYLAVDESTRVIGLCIESVKDGRRLVNVASRCKKPIIVIKLGKEVAGQRAAKSHTGSIAGKYEIYKAAFHRCGMIEADNLDEFIDLLKMFYIGRGRGGRKILIVTNGGGIGVMTADLCNKSGLEVPPLPVRKREMLKRALPSYYSLSNPVDLTGSSTNAQYGLVLKTCAKDFDGIIIIPFMTVPGLTPALSKHVIDALKDYTGTVVSLRSFTHEGMKVETTFAEGGIPVFQTPERAVRALWKFLTRETPEIFSDKRLEKNKIIYHFLEAARKEDRHMLSYKETIGVLNEMGLPCAPSGLAMSLSKAVSVAKGIGFPVALKVSSTHIYHKTDIGGIRLDIGGIGELKKAWKELKRNISSKLPFHSIDGIVVQKMIKEGIEVIIGAIRDPQFGPVVMFGPGGVWVELFGEMRLDMAPLAISRAKRMIRSSKVYPLVKGYRGMEAMDIKDLARVLTGVADLMIAFPEIQEMEFNPVKISPGGLHIIDARILLK